MALFGGKMPMGGQSGANLAPTDIYNAPGLFEPDMGRIAGMQTPGPVKPSFFGQGGTGRTIAGILGDTLSTLGGGQATYAPMMQQQRAMDENRQYEDQQWQRRNQQQFEHQRQLAEYTARNRAPTAMQQNYDWMRSQNPELADTYLKNQANPLRWITGTDAMGNPTVIPVPSGGVNAPPSAPVGELTPYNGGQSSGSTGTFRR